MSERRDIVHLVVRMTDGASDAYDRPLAVVLDQDGVHVHISTLRTALYPWINVSKVVVTEKEDATDSSR